MTTNPMDKDTETNTITASIGRIVHYTLAAYDAQAINDRRQRAEGDRVGNTARADDEYPMMIVRVWTSDMVNGQVLLDGDDTYWVTSRMQGDGQGRWHAPVRA